MPSRVSVILFCLFRWIKEAGGTLDLNETVDENTGRMNLFQSDAPDGDNFFNLGNHYLARRRHDRIEVAHGIAVAEVAQAIAPVSLDEGEVRRQGLLKHIFPSIDDACLLAYSQVGPHCRRSIKTAQTGAGGANPLDEGSLRHQFEFHFAFQIAVPERSAPRAGRKRGHQFANSSVEDETAQSKIAAAGAIMHDGQIGRPLLSERFNQLSGNAGIAESADHDSGAIEHLRHRLSTGWYGLVDHGVPGQLIE